MKKKLFVLEFDKGVDQEFKRWTKEAVQEFIDLFPEYKDNFQINENQSYYSKQEVEDIIARSINDGVSANLIWDMFDLQPDGTYLRHNSLDYDVKQALLNDRVDISKLLSVRHENEGTFPVDEPILVSIISRPTTLGYGISNQRDACISTAACGKNKEYFKEIIEHELGHVFRATHKARCNTVDNLGSHCLDEDCLMFEYAYTQKSFNRRQRNNKPLFCDDCLESMREYMENTLLLKRKNQEEISVTNENTEGTSQTRQIENASRAFKADIRAVFKSSAKKEGAKYKENIQSPTYSAEIARSDGSVDFVSAANARQINMSAKDKDGKICVPSMKRFEDIAAYAQSKNMAVNFGDIKTEDFKAKLMLACLSHEPPVKMTNAPTITDAFFNGIKDEMLKQKLKNKVPKLQVQNCDSSNTNNSVIHAKSKIQPQILSQNRYNNR